MKRNAAITPLFLALSFLLSCSGNQSWKPAVYLQGGTRELANADFEPADRMDTLGAEAVGWVENLVIQPELGIVGSSASGTEPTGGGSTDWSTKVYELYGGVRKQWKLGLLWPYVGAGLTLVDAQAEQRPQGMPEIDDSSTSVGAYGRIGLDLMFTKKFSIGIDGRYVIGTSIEVDGQQTDADGVVGTFRIGWAF